MEFSVKAHKPDVLDNQVIRGLIQHLNANCDVEFADSDLYLFQSLYFQIFNQFAREPPASCFSDFSAKLREILPSEAKELFNRYQAFSEKIMLNTACKSLILDTLSKRVYHMLHNEEDKK